MSEQGPDGKAEVVWQRLPPFAMLPLVIRGAIDIVRNAWQGLAGMAAAVHFTTDGTGPVFWSILGILFLLLVITGGILQWWHFRFAPGARAITLRRGVFSRRVVHLEYARVQNIRITAPFYLRPFGAVTLALDSAGSEAEIMLPAVSRALADEIAARVRASQDDAPSAGAASSAVEGGLARSSAEEAGDAGGAVIIARDARALLRHGLASNTAWAAAGLFASLLASNPDRVGRAIIGAVESVVGGIDALGWAATAALVLGGIVAVVAVALLLSVLGSILHFYGFVLREEKGAWRASHGLLERRETVVGKSKLQALVLRQTAVGRLMGLWEVQFHQAGGIAGADASSGARGPARRLVVPGLDAAALARLLAAIMPGADPFASPAGRPDPFFVTHQARLAALGLMGLLAVVLGLRMTPVAADSLGGGVVAWAAIAAVTLWLAVLLVLIRRRREHGWRREADLMVVREGLLGRRIFLFQPFKTQWIALETSPARRRRELVDVVVALAGRRLRLPYARADEGEGLRAVLARAAARDPRPWL